MILPVFWLNVSNPISRKLGPKCGKSMKTVANLLQNLSQTDIAKLEKTASSFGGGRSADWWWKRLMWKSSRRYSWLAGCQQWRIDHCPGYSAYPELLKEGIAREFINRIQNLCKSSGFDIVDRIAVKIEHNDHVNDAVEAFSDYIQLPVTLAKEVVWLINFRTLPNWILMISR